MNERTSLGLDDGLALAIAFAERARRPGAQVHEVGMNARGFLDTALAGRRAWREAQTVMREIVEQHPDGSGDDDDF